MAEQRESLLDLLVAGDALRTQKFEELDAVICAIAKTDPTTQYQYASATQSIESFQWATNFATSGNLESNNFSANKNKLAISMRLWCYDKGKTPSLMKAFRWEKNTAILDLSRSMQAALASSSLLSFIVLIRPILEQVAAASSCTTELEKLLSTEVVSLEEKSDKIIEAAVIVSRRGKGTRIDWESYLAKSLKEGKKKSYKPEVGSVDLTASDLMKTIDSLDKRIKGARKAYEFASEFAHPNIGLHLLYVDSADRTVLTDGLTLWNRKYHRDSPRYAITQLRDRLLELVDITTESIHAFRIDFDKMRKQELTVSKLAKEIIRTSVKRHPLLFHLREQCPCFSGDAFSACCGKKVRGIHKQILG